MRFFFWLACLGFMIAMASPAVAHDSAVGYRPGYYWDGNQWNPLQGYAPWREPVAVNAYPYAYGTSTVYGAPVPRRIVRERYRYRTTVPGRYTHDLNLGGYPAGAPSYQYKFYNP
jgi:hypothetical protein